MDELDNVDGGSYRAFDDFDCEDYQELKANFNSADFVSPLEVMCELWELKGDLPTKRSSHRVLPAEADDIPIWLSDMVPHNQINPADDRSTTIDLNLYRHYHTTWFKASKARHMESARPSSTP